MFILALQIAATAFILLVPTTILVRVTTPGWLEPETRLHISLLILLFVEIIVIVGAVLVAIWHIPDITSLCS